MTQTGERFKIGCQGWNYSDWITGPADETIFYPAGTKPAAMLGLYSRVFSTVEVDSSFYAIPSQSTIENWYNKTPAEFTFSLKLLQEITHKLDLNESSYELLESFCERSRLLKEKLGVVLIQLPPQFYATRQNAQNLRSFLGRLPRDIRFAVEFRNREWFVDWTFEQLKKSGTAPCFVEGGWVPREMMFAAIKENTSDFTYTRFMGERDLSDFSRVVRPQDENLAIWKSQLAELNGSSNFVYFSNFYEGFAPSGTMKLKEMFEQETVDLSSLEDQRSLF